MSPAPSALKLLYFNFGGKAQVLRSILRLGGVPFTDERLSGHEFWTLKPSLPYGQIPVLEVTTGETVVQIAESQAILRYAARLAGMYPTTDAVAALMVDEAIASVDEWASTQLSPSMVERDAAKKKQIREALLAGPLPKFLGQLESRLQRMGKYPFFANNSKIYAHDVVISEFVDGFASGNVDYIPTDVVSPYAAMVATHAKVKAASAQTQAPVMPSETVSVPAKVPSKLKLTYFAGAGRGEHIRLALHIGGIDFEDERMSYKEFSERKSSFPFEKVPVMQIDEGVVVAQSFPLLRYAGVIGGLYPVNDPLEAAKTDELISRVDDLFYKMAPSFREGDPEKKRMLREQMVESVIKPSLQAIDKRVAAWKKPSSPYIVGDSISIADLVVYFIVGMLSSGGMDHIPVSVADGYSHLIAVTDAVREHPRVQDWYANH